MTRPLATCALVVCAAILAIQVQPLSAQSQGRGRGLGKAAPGSRGRKAIRVQMPSEMGVRSGTEAVEALLGDLAQKVRDRGGDPEQYARALAADESLWIDGDGQLMFVDAIDHDATPAAGDPTTVEPATPSGPPPQPIRLLPSGLPIHHSKASAPWKIFLDFDGATVRPGPGSIVRRPATTQGLTIDADPTTFTSEEQAVVSRTWGRVAEDWAPFNVDVTTEEPPLIDGHVLWSIVGRHPSEIGFGKSNSFFALDHRLDSPIPMY